MCCGFHGIFFREFSGNRRASIVLPVKPDEVSALDCVCFRDQGGNRPVSIVLLSTAFNDTLYQEEDYP